MMSNVVVNAMAMNYSKSHTSFPNADDSAGPTFAETFGQHKASTRLLGSQESETTLHSQTFLGYDDNDVHAFQGDNGELGGGESKTSTTVLWEGLPLYGLTWELLTIVLSGCFLGMRALLWD